MKPRSSDTKEGSETNWEFGAELLRSSERNPPYRAVPPLTASALRAQVIVRVECI